MADRWTADIRIPQRMLTESRSDPLSAANQAIRQAMDAAVDVPAQAARDAGCGCAMIGPELVEDGPEVLVARVLWLLLPGTPESRLFQFPTRAAFDRWVLDGMPL